MEYTFRDLVYEYETYRTFTMRYKCYIIMYIAVIGMYLHTYTVV